MATTTQDQTIHRTESTVDNAHLNQELVPCQTSNPLYKRETASEAMETSLQSHPCQFCERFLTALVACIGLVIYQPGLQLSSPEPIRQTSLSAHAYQELAFRNNSPQSRLKSSTVQFISHRPEGAEDGITNGIYIYGQSQTPFEIGHEYLVFEVHGHFIFGASYFPYSEFVCFTGRLEDNTLNLLAITPDGPDASSQPNVPVLSAALSPLSSALYEQENPLSPINLSEYKVIPDLSAIDLDILNYCRQDNSMINSKKTI